MSSGDCGGDAPVAGAPASLSPPPPPRIATTPPAAVAIAPTSAPFPGRRSLGQTRQLQVVGHRRCPAPRYFVPCPCPISVLLCGRLRPSLLPCPHLAGGHLGDPAVGGSWLLASLPRACLPSSRSSSVRLLRCCARPRSTTLSSPSRRPVRPWLRSWRPPASEIPRLSGLGSTSPLAPSAPRPAWFALGWVGCLRLPPLRQE